MKLNGKSRVSGRVRFMVLDVLGRVKKGERSFWRRFFGLQALSLCGENNNIITKQGDALLADLLLATPNKTKIVAGAGFMQIGTGWTGNSTKQNTRCNTPSGSMAVIDEGFPVTLAAFGSVGDSVVKYRATFAPGTLNASGINEACLLNGNTGAAVSLAYAQLSPAVQVSGADTLIVEWEITFLGS